MTYQIITPAIERELRKIEAAYSFFPQGSERPALSALKHAYTSGWAAGATWANNYPHSLEQSQEMNNAPGFVAPSGQSPTVD